MRESSARRHICKACPDSRRDTATPAGYSLLLASRPYFLLPSTTLSRSDSHSASGLWFVRSPALNRLSEGFRCSEHISTLKNPGSERISAFLWVFGLFSGIRKNAD